MRCLLEPWLSPSYHVKYFIDILLCNDTKRASLQGPPDIYRYVMGKEGLRCPKVSYSLNSREMQQLYHTEEILSCLCSVSMVGCVLKKIKFEEAWTIRD